MCGICLRFISFFISFETSSLHIFPCDHLYMTTCTIHTPFQRSTVDFAWYEDRSNYVEKGCRESNAEKQYKQWSHCMSMIERYEGSVRARSDGFTFDTVIKLRPDDLW
jgi:hypothetical protein